jgi:hypothetical protein
MPQKVTRQQIFADKFPTIKSIIEDPVFSAKAISWAKQAIKHRTERPEPELGKKYVRTWVDTLIESNEPILRAIADVWAKQSKLSADVRKNLETIGNYWLADAITYYHKEANRVEPTKAVK